MKSENLNNIATQLYKEGKRDTALALVRRAVALEPDNECYQVNLGCILTNYGEYEKARQIFLDVLDKNRDSVLAWHGYGVLEMVSARPREAIKCFAHCVRLEPKNGSHLFDHACAVMQSGDWKSGFQLYECRRKWKPERQFEQFQEWNGETGKKIYVWAEQGIGDTIQYSRYLPWLIERSEKVTFAVPPYLFELFKDFQQLCKVVPLTGAMVDADYHVPLMSLAHYYKQDGREDIPEPSEFFECSLGTDKKNGIRIGLCWACNSTSINYRERSLPFEKLLRLTELDADFISLQVGDSAADIAKARAQNLVRDMSGEINDNWDATRRLIADCDYVVSTDTSVAHLATSMGIPTIMFLARRDWWRWGNAGSTSVWYPSMTIIRQDIPFKWENEIEEAYAILKNAVTNRQQDILAA